MLEEVLAALPTDILVPQEVRRRPEERNWVYKDYAIFIQVYEGEDNAIWKMATVIHLDLLNSVTQLRAGKRWQSVALRTNGNIVMSIHFHLQSTNDLAIYAEPLQQISEAHEETMSTSIMGDFDTHLTDKDMRWLHEARDGEGHEPDRQTPTATTTNRRGRALRNWLMENGYQWSM